MVVVGGGLIGTAIARGIAERGARVTLVDDGRAGTASPVAAGMLAPATEIAPTEIGLLQLNLASLERYPEFVEELSGATGLPVGLRRSATVSVAADTDDVARLDDLAEILAGCGLSAERCTGRQVRRRVPLLAPRIRAGLVIERDWSVDNRLLWAALRVAAEGSGVVHHHGTVTELVVEDGRCAGVVMADHTRLPADTVVWAAGAWAGEVVGFDLPIRPVKGQVVRLRAHDLPIPEVTVRAFVRGFEVYLVPRESGELVIGATVEDRGFDTSATAGGVHDLLRDARTVLPITAEYEFAEVSVGFRPASADHSPILGPSPIDGLVLAVGHHRNGVLLTPITAELITDLVVDGTWPQLGASFNPYPESER